MCALTQDGLQLQTPLESTPSGLGLGIQSRAIVMVSQQPSVSLCDAVALQLDRLPLRADGPPYGRRTPNRTSFESWANSVVGFTDLICAKPEVAHIPRYPPTNGPGCYATNVTTTDTSS